MSSFKLIDEIHQSYKGKFYYKDRNLSIMEFNYRILDIIKAKKDQYECLKFIRILFTNITEFISIRLPEIPINEKEKYIFYIRELLYKLDYLFTQKIDLPLPHIKDNLILNKTSFTDKGIYYVYIDDNRQFNIIPYKINEAECFKLANQMSNKVVFSFLIRMISDKSVDYIYTGETTSEILEEIKALVKYQEDEQFISMQSTCSSDLIMKRFFEYLGLNIESYFYISQNLILIDSYYAEYKDFINPPQKTVCIDEIDYYEAIKNKDKFFYVPYDSYDYILSFINQMCNHPNITSIFVSLYRVANNSQIIKSLINAKQSGKNVYVYVEVIARGDEKNNIKLIEYLISNGIDVSCNYFNYKVHSKIFLAIDKSGKIYSHISTGNYNEITAQSYTDFHLLTANDDITKKLFNIMKAIFTKTIYSSMTDNIIVAPFDMRNRLVALIENEIVRSENGNNAFIDIKCNSLCDLLIIDKLYQAADAGVKIRIIVRTGCSILPNKNIMIKSKIGEYLEHDRFYNFGGEYYIGSADLLSRNLDKRIEILCKIFDKDIINKISSIFESLWDSNLYILSQDDYKWEQE